jgi:hypothetical protein
MKVVIEASVGLPLAGNQHAKAFQPYFDTLTWSEYLTGRADNALAVAQLLQPDYMTVLTEPDTEAAVSGPANVDTVSGATLLVQQVLTTLEDAGVTGIQILARAGTCHGALGYLTAWPDGSGVPIAASLHSPGGIVIANAALVPAVTSGAVSLYASDDTDVVIDINGYIASPGTPQALEFYPVTPCRIADTRTGSGFTGSFEPPALVAGATRDFPVQQSTCGISSTAHLRLGEAPAS